MVDTYLAAKMCKSVFLKAYRIFAATNFVSYVRKYLRQFRRHFYPKKNGAKKFVSRSRIRGQSWMSWILIKTSSAQDCTKRFTLDRTSSRLIWKATSSAYLSLLRTCSCNINVFMRSDPPPQYQYDVINSDQNVQCSGLL